jgi:hypothetical protein
MAPVGTPEGRSRNKVELPFEHKEAALPAIKKGVSLPIQVAVTSWIDLLGYGAMIANARFNPLNVNSIHATRRLREFHRIVAAHSARRFPTLVMNDGAVAYRDLSFRSASVTYDFVCRSWDVFCAVNKAEAKAEFPGARMVVATGFRMRGRRAGIDATAGHLASLLRRLQAGEIDATQAVREAIRNKPSFDVVPQLQANYAFTKAYVAEQSGEKGGLGGSFCYVDFALFDDNWPDWIRVGQPVPWSHERLKLQGVFAPVVAIKRSRHPRGHPPGIRDALQVAQRLTNDPEVLRRMRGLPPGF